MNITLHEAQSEVFSDLFVNQSVLNSVVVASRGFGKSFLMAACSVQAVSELVELSPDIPNKRVVIIAPTFDQALSIYEPILFNTFRMDRYVLGGNRGKGVYKFPNNTELRIASYEAVERLRGGGFYFAGIDEPESWTGVTGLKGAWEGVIEPAIQTRWSRMHQQRYGAKSPGRALFIGTPKGFTYFFDLYSINSGDWKSYHFDYTCSPYLDQNAIKKLMNRLDPLEFAREYKADFKESGANVFHSFDRKEHVYEVDDFIEGEIVHLGIDFNVGLQCTSAWAIRGDQAHCINEFKGLPDTETLAHVLRETYKGHKLIAYPDPSGNSRKTSAVVGRTDFSILRNAGISVVAPKAAPSIRASALAVNRMLKSADGTVRVFVHPRCKEVTRSLERTQWLDNNPDLAVIDKRMGVEHFSDGIRYFFSSRFPAAMDTVNIVHTGKLL